MKSESTNWKFRFLLPFLILSIPFLKFILHNLLNWKSPEVLSSLGGLGVIILLCGVVLVGVSGSRVLSNLLIAGLVTLFLDIQFDFLQGGYHLVGTWLAFLMLAWVLKDNFYRIATVIFGVFFVVTIFEILPSLGEGHGFQNGRENIRLAGKMVSDNPKSLPRIIHLILDEHIGLEGIPTDIAQGKILKEQLVHFYQHYGFHIFGGAFSHFYDTAESISNMLNFSADSQLSKHFESLSGNRLQHNKYFEILSKAGYQINVFGADHIDYCAETRVKIQNCMVFPASSLLGLNKIEAPTSVKSQVVLSHYFNLSYLYRRGRDLYKAYQPTLAQVGLSLPAWMWDWSDATMASLNNMLLLEGLWKDILALPQGNVLFAHLLIPHNPYNLEGDCSIVSPIKEWKSRYLERTHGGNTAHSREVRYRLYFEQVRCLYSWLDKLFEEMNAHGQFDDSIILVHGDHGSRIVRTEPVMKNMETLTEQDLIDGFSTLFAVKFPVRPGKYDTLPRPIELLLENVVSEIAGSGGLLEQEISSPSFVYIMPKNPESDKYFVRVSYPGIW